MGDTGKESPPRDGQNVRSACTECQRRKQKCNRQWPCNHCQKRKVADQCRFKDIATPKTPPDASNANKKRGRIVETEIEDDEVDVDGDEADDADAFEKLGYAPGRFNAAIQGADEKTERRTRKQDYREMSSCPQLQHAVNELPPRPYTDSLVQNFINNVNYHYYIIYPNTFLNEYREWWDDRSANRPLGLQWTCLLLQICACSAQYIPEDLQKKLAGDLGQSSQQLTEKYHKAASELQTAIPVGHAHLLNVQSLLHSCYWFKSEAKFVECWHILNLAIREAQELGIDKEGSTGQVSEFEREMNRRVWVVLDTWDWQISALLSRPMIIDRTDCDVGLPALSLENFNISPLLHMKMQSELISRLAKRFGLPKNVTEPADVQEYQKIMEQWMNTFPPTYDFKNPDTSDDEANPWIKLHRHYLHTMGYSMTLDPIRAYLAKPMNSKTTPPRELQIRSDGITYALKIMNALYGFFEHVWPRDAKFHFVIFCIFDTAAVYSSVIMHDEDDSAPQRQEMLKAMEGALGMIKKLRVPIPAAKMYHDILTRLYKKTWKKMNKGKTAVAEAPRKKARVKSLANSIEKKETKVAYRSDASASSEGKQANDQQSASQTSSEAFQEQQQQQQQQQQQPQQPQQQPLFYPQPPPIPPSTIPAQPLYDFNPTPFLNDTYPIQDPTLFNGAACVLDGGGGLPPLPNGEFMSSGEFVPGVMPDMNWAPMSEAELGPLGELWRWKSLDLGLVNTGEGIDPAQLDLGSFAGNDNGNGNGNGYGHVGGSDGDQAAGISGYNENINGGTNGPNGDPSGTVNGFTGSLNGGPNVRNGHGNWHDGNGHAY